MSCENNDSLPAPENPDIVLESNEIYGGPNRIFEIKALLKDAIGLKTVDINIPELDLEKTITFSTNPITKEYNLNYKFLVPSDKTITDTFKIELILTDISGNFVKKDIDLRLDFFTVLLL